MKKVFIVIAAFFLLPLSAAAAALTEIDLLWEADVYTPPFYLGHSRASPQSTVRVVALPNFVTAGGKKIKTEELNFAWVKDLKNISSQSGPGQNILTYTAEASGSNRISVTVSTRDGSLTDERNLTINVSPPKLVLYEDDPLTGVTYHQALGQELNLDQPEISIVAEPFFFDWTAGLEKKIDYDWRLNDKKIISNPAEQKVATFAVPEGGQGSNLITVLAKNTKNTLQSARRNLVIKFGQWEFNF